MNSVDYSRTIIAREGDDMAKKKAKYKSGGARARDKGYRAVLLQLTKEQVESIDRARQNPLTGGKEPRTQFVLRAALAQAAKINERKK